jgi:hypothetical protein
LDDDLVMADLESGNYYGLVGPGRRIWDLLAEPICVGDLCLAVRAEYDVDTETCEREVLEFLNDLYRDRLIASR